MVRAPLLAVVALLAGVVLQSAGAAAKGEERVLVVLATAGPTPYTTGDVERVAAAADTQAVADDLAALRERLEPKGRTVAFGLEIMGRVRELGTPEDVFWLSARFDWVRPVLDFAHLHAVTDGAFLEADAFAGILEAADAVLEPGAPYHVHFSDIAYANRNETKHLAYGEGTLRAEPLAEALRRFERPATVISESPDEQSSRAIASALGL